MVGSTRVKQFTFPERGLALQSSPSCIWRCTRWSGWRSWEVSAMASTTFSVTKGGFTFLDNATASDVLNANFSWVRLLDLRVVLFGLTHSFASDLDFLLVSPSGVGFEFWSEPGQLSALPTATSQLRIPVHRRCRSTRQSPQVRTGLRTILQPKLVVTGAAWHRTLPSTIRHPTARLPSTQCLVGCPWAATGASTSGTMSA
jgi:hypothetical protein